MVGKMMKETKGTADPKVARRLILKKLQEDTPNTPEGDLLAVIENQRLL